jgi:DNA replication initiation complex subunit (GINS family)
MYAELCAAWQQEIEGAELGSLPDAFFVDVADYARRIKEETRMLDKKSIKAGLLARELQNVKRMLRELVAARYKKLVKAVGEGQKMPVDLLTAEEAEICAGYISFAEAYQKFAHNLLQGQVVKATVAKARKRVALRFVKAIPAVIGADMQAYGPFMVEDVASLPVENAKVLVKQGLAVAVEAS